MKNKDLQNELQKFSDDTDVNVVLSRGFIDSQDFIEMLNRETYYIVCEFGVAIDTIGIQLTPYFCRDENKVTFSNPMLEVCAIGEEGEYSANPDDYFTVGDDHVFEDRYLTCTCERDGWTKRIIVKENPTKADLKNWKELAEKVKIE